MTTVMLAFLASIQLFALTPAFAADDQIYSMTADGGMTLVSSATYVAQSFSTGSDQVTLSTVNVRIRNASGNGLHFNVALYSSSAGQPGSKIADLASNININIWEEFNDAYPSTQLIDANTQYFIVVSGNQSSGPGWKFNSQAPTSTLSPLPTFSSYVSNNAGSTWSAIPNQNYNMVVAVAPYTPPPPPPPPPPPVQPVLPDPVQMNSISGIAPASGGTAGGNIVVLSGSFVAPITALQIDNVVLASTEWSQSSSAVAIKMPAHATGDAVIQLFDGQAPLLQAQRYTYTDAPAPMPSATPSPTPTPSSTASATATPTPSPVTTPSQSPTPTPAPTQSATPTPSATPAPSPVPTRTPASAPSVSASPTPTVTATPTPAATKSATPAPSSSLSTTAKQLVNSLLTDDAITGPQITLTTDIAIGEVAAGKSLHVSVSELKPNSTVEIYIYSTPRLIGTLTVDGGGSAIGDLQIPTDIAIGDHKVFISGTGSDGSSVEALTAFRLDSEGTVVAFAPPAQVSGPLEELEPKLVRALAAGKPLYDLKLHPGTVATVALAVTTLVGVAGVAGSQNLPRPNRDKASQGKLASVVTKKLKAVKVGGEGPGDSSWTWRSPGTAATDQGIKSAALKSGRASALAPRLLVDGSWARAMFGSAGLLLWLAGAALGLVSALQVHMQALPPSLGLVLAIVALGNLDAFAGASAWLVMALLALITGHMSTWADLRTALGMFVLFSSVPLLAHAIRPLRRIMDGSWMQRFDRAADYVMPPIFLAFAASSMFKALNGLSGLQLVSKSDFGILRIVVIVSFLVRMLMEDIALTWYPQRTLAVQPEKLSSTTTLANWLAIVGKLAVFLLISAPFFGLGRYTMLALALTALLMVMKLYEDKLPNSVTLNKWYPRGVLKFLIMLVVGIYYSAFILGDHASADKVKGTFALMLLPGVVTGLLEFFGREGGIWPENWWKRLAGSAVWLTAIGMVLGYISIR